MVRTLTVTDAAYTALKSQKRPGESFTDAVLRVTGRPSLRQLSEAMTPRESASLAEAHLAARRERAPASGAASADVDIRGRRL